MSYAFSPVMSEMPTRPPYTDVTRSAAAEMQMLETKGCTSRPIVLVPIIAQSAGHLPITNSVFGNRFAFSVAMF